MSEDQLYEIARKRIDKRNRRWILWGVNFLAFLIYVGAYASFGITNPGVRHLGEFIALAWFGVLVLHAVTIGMTQNRDEAIDSEVAKLRSLVYEKPKRLELTDDGELTDIDDDLDERPDTRPSNSL